MPRGVEYSGDYNCLLLINHFVNHAIGETLRISPTNVFARMSAAVKQGIARKFIENCQELFDESVAKTFALAFIPRCDLDYVILRFRAVREPSRSFTSFAI
jgi:hypothetical protein